MAGLLLYHHSQGLTDGLGSLADEIRTAGHTVHTPDLYDGKTFAELDAGFACAKEVGFGTIPERGRPPPRACRTSWSTRGSGSG